MEEKAQATKPIFGDRLIEKVLAKIGSGTGVHALQLDKAIPFEAFVAKRGKGRSLEKEGYTKEERSVGGILVDLFYKEVEK